MLAQPIARSFDLDYHGMVKKPVEQCRGDHGVPKNLTPLGKPAVRGQDHGAFFVAGVDQLEEQISATRHDGQVADFVDDQQRWAAEIPDPLAQGPFAFGPGEPGNQIGQC